MKPRPKMSSILWAYQDDVDYFYSTGVFSDALYELLYEFYRQYMPEPIRTGTKEQQRDWIADVFYRFLYE